MIQRMIRWTAGLFMALALGTTAAAELTLVRHGPVGEEKPGLIDAEGRIRDLSDYVDDLSPLWLSDHRLEMIASIDVATLPVVDPGVRLGTPVAGSRKIIAIGFNYVEHAEEMATDVPEEPLTFSKAITALSGPHDDVVSPRGTTKLDYEAELVAVIGRRARYVSEADALDHVAGFAVGHDVSERAFQRERGGQFVKGKSADTFAPVGPWLVTRDSVDDIQSLDVWSEVNGETRQEGNTDQMVFGVAHIISHLSQFMTLEPGDLIFTGTPDGVGDGMRPPQYLQPGDVVRIGIDGLGEQRQRIAPAP